MSAEGTRGIEEIHKTIDGRVVTAQRTADGGFLSAAGIRKRDHGRWLALAGRRGARIANGRDLARRLRTGPEWRLPEARSNHPRAALAPAEKRPPLPPRREDPVAAMAAIIGHPCTVHARLELSSEPRAARQVRHFVVDKLREWDCTALAESAELICTELATNAILHGRSKPPDEQETICLVLSLRPDAALVIQMTDNSLLPPVPRVSGRDSETGRGLHLLASLADAWTWRPKADGSGKSVWAYLRDPSATAS